MATWLHCLIADGSVVALSRDKNFNKNGSLSSTMKKKFFHVKVADSIEVMRPYVGPKEGIVLPGFEEDGPPILEKFKSYIDMDEFFTDKTLLANIENGDREVNPIASFQDKMIIKSR